MKNKFLLLVLTAALASPMTRANSEETANHEGHEHHAVGAKHSDKKHKHTKKCDKHMVDGKMCDEHVKEESAAPKEEKKAG